MIEFIKVRIKNNEKVKEEFSFEDMKDAIAHYGQCDTIVGFISINEKLAYKNFFKIERINISIISGYKVKAKQEGLNLSKFLYFLSIL